MGEWHIGLEQQGGNTFMKMPLSKGDELIRTVLAEQWHLEVSGIHFIPIGDSAYSYRVEARPNSSYYLKVIDQRMSAGRRTAAHMGFTLPLQHLVAKLCLAEVNAPLPQPTITGALHAIHEPFLFALYTFIHGETLADAYPMAPALIRRIGQALATLHTIRIPEALQQRSPQDRLTTPFDADLLTDLAALETISSHDALYLQRLREVTWPRREQIRAFLAERDAFMYLGYLGTEFTAFDTGYRMIHQEPMHWHAEWLAYYAYRRQLRNLAYWLHNLLHEPLDEVQRDNDVTMIEYHCLDRLESVERTATELVASSGDERI
jgi:spectinomycin phosphotransferase